MTFPAGRITGLQSADCIEMIEIHDGGGKIETRVRESCCTVAHVYSSYESDAARLRSAPYSGVENLKNKKSYYRPRARKRSEKSPKA